MCSLGAYFVTGVARGPAARLGKSLHTKDMQEKSMCPANERFLPDEVLRFGPMGQYLIENLPLGVVTFDPQLTITDRNCVAEKMLAPLANIAEALAVGTDGFGQDCWETQLRGVLAANKQRTFESVSYMRDAGTFVLQIICTPLRDEVSGRQLGGILLLEDVTAKAVMQRELATAERLAAVGRLAARVAHELNNPLDGILRYINLALRVTEENGQEQTSQYLQESRKGLLRMVQIISELLEFSRNTYSAFEEANINKIVEEAAVTMEAQASDNQVAVRRQYDPEAPNIRSGNLFQVFCNLIKNAIDAMEAGGELEVRTRLAAGQVFVEFADTGPGLTKEVQQKLFEPFFTTKAGNKGTGLGLAICKDIVERYGGKILAENRPQGGSVFTVRIPLERGVEGDQSS